MGDRRGGPNFASCLVALVFLILIAAVVVIVFFVVFRPREPSIRVDAVQLPGFTQTNNGSSVSFTFSQYAAVKNPNRASFTHYDSTLQLVNGETQLGFMFIPAGEIAAGRTQFMAASFSVNSLPLVAAGGGGNAVVELESVMRVKGRVKVLKFFTHHVEAKSGCKVGVSVHDGTVLGFRC